MSKHTPAPWIIDTRTRWDEPPVGQSICCVDNAYGGISICAGYPTATPLPDAETLDAIGLSNARLICAAPDLLAALVNVVSAFDIAGKVHAGEISAARAAIAKALEGQS